MDGDTKYTTSQKFLLARKRPSYAKHPEITARYCVQFNGGFKLQQTKALKYRKGKERPVS